MLRAVFRVQAGLPARRLFRMQALNQTGRENIPDQVTKAEPVHALRVKRLSERAILPKRGSAGAAGYDLAR